MARPSIYSKEIGDRICELISTSSFGLHTICKSNDDLPAFSTVFKWLSDADKTEFLDNYTRARDMQADFMADEILTIADDASNDFMTVVKGDVSYEVENKELTSRSRLRVESRKWVASKLKPKKYGEKVDITSGNEPLKSFDLTLNIPPPRKDEG